MSTINFDGQIIECEQGDNLRHVLRSTQLPLYNGIANTVHCRGLGDFGSCAVEIEGEVTKLTRIEKWRLGFPPHKPGSGLRFACHCCVLGDLIITKHGGMRRNKISGDS